MTTHSGSRMTDNVAIPAPSHWPVVLKAASATASPSPAASVIALPVSPSIVPSPRESKLRAISGLAAIASRACRNSAFPEAYCSKHPRAPHPQRWPSGTTRMCPISAAIPNAPRYKSPFTTIPPPIPVPIVIINI